MSTALVLVFAIGILNLAGSAVGAQPIVTGMALWWLVLLVMSIGVYELRRHFFRRRRHARCDAASSRAFD